MGRTKTEAALEAAERQHADDPERAELLARARRFKASWLELAEGLSEVRKAGHWKRWGHPSFEEYTRKELHLRDETVAKLTGSFLFLQRRAPQVLQRDGVETPIPSYQAIDFLRQAEEQEHVPEEAKAEIRRRVIDEGAALPGITRKYRSVVFPLDDEEQKAKDAASLRGAARRLRELLAETRAVTRKLAHETSETLDRLIEALGEDEAQAA